MTLPTLLMLSTLAMLSLTNCSSVPHEGPLPTVVQPLQEETPSRPAPLHLYNEPFTVCGKMLCLKPEEARRSLQNKVEFIRWVKQANAIFEFYERRTGGNFTGTLATP